MHTVENKLLRFVRRHRLLNDGERVVVAFSGGPDSVALALLLEAIARGAVPGLRLHLAHLNHCLRGAESDADEQFCRAFAGEHGLPITVERAEVGPSAARHGRSVEAEARRLRYDFLGRVAERAGAAVVATGHQADDVAEGVLLRMLRGAGVLGLGAMAPQRPLSTDRPGIRLVRPLMDLRREEILDYLASRGQPYRTDSSNLSMDYMRNRVRHELIPALGREFPMFSTGSLCALNESAVETARLLDDLLGAAWGDLCIERSDHGMALEAVAFARLAPPLRKAAVKRALEELTGAAAPDLRSEHYRAAAALAEAAVGAEISLPGGFLARREHGAVYLAQHRNRGGIPPRTLPVPGAVEVPEAGVRISCGLLPASKFGPEDAARRASGREVFVNAESLRGPLTVRSRRPGDRFHPLGAPGSAKLKEFFINSKVPLRERDRTPVVTTSESEIVWVVGQRIGEKFRLTDGAGQVVRLLATDLG